MTNVELPCHFKHCPKNGLTKYSELSHYFDWREKSKNDFDALILRCLRGSSINDVTALGGREYLGFCEDSTKALVIKSVTKGGGGVKNYQILREVIYGRPHQSLIFLQMDNAARIVENGLGVQLFKSYLTEENIYQAIAEVISNKRFVKR